MTVIFLILTCAGAAHLLMELGPTSLRRTVIGVAVTWAKLCILFWLSWLVFGDDDAIYWTASGARAALIGLGLHFS
jgi:hypothetical protein